MTGYLLPLPPFAAQISEGNVVQAPVKAVNLFSIYKLQWRRDTLWVSLGTASPSLDPVRSDPMRSEPLSQQIATRLKHSAVCSVCIDPQVGEKHLQAWAEACKQAKKPLYLRVPGMASPKAMAPLSWMAKRFFDVSVTMVGCIAISPLLFVIGVLVKLSSPGPVFYRQWRVGDRGRLFQIWKFRSMVAEAESMHHRVMGEQNGLHKQVDDPRITPIGRWLRKYSLDELPQLMNVLCGEMSLVGPRPWAFYDALRVPTSGLGRLRAMPGITGEWQVIARSNLRDMASVTQCDLDYLKGWSISRDFRLLLMTFPKVLAGFGAY